MCGILYSQNDNKFDNLDPLKKRGPDGFSEIHNDLGYFAFSLLNTIGESTAQPFVTKHGILLYNGSTYNSKGMNDTKWVGDQLDDNLENTIEVIRSLRGEYALIYVTETHIVFCTDEFYQRNLWFYFSETEKQISICTIPIILKNKHGSAWYVDENKIYVVDRNNFSINVVNNRTWNFEQKTNHYDYVLEKFEQAVKDRHDTRITTNLQSSGVDSGAINCACLNFFDNHKAITNIDGESKEILKQRLKKHKFIITKYDGHQLEKKRMFREIHDSYEIFAFGGEVDPLIHCFRFISNKHKNRVVIGGAGGDEIYNSMHGQCHGFITARTNGSFPEDLKLVWPWYNHPGTRLLIANQRYDFIAGWFGLEIRNPHLDQDLVQAWLNTTQKLKNIDGKGWMKMYMKMHDYPYTSEKFPFNEGSYELPDFYGL